MRNDVPDSPAPYCEPASSSQMPALVRALLEPQRYGAGVQTVEWVQTHISWVFLAGDYAYKIKKPVKLQFLDFSTLAQRQRCCEEELRLNRRYSPDIYVGVVGLFNTPQDPRWEGPGSPIEYAVKMRRFDGAGRLDRVCARGELTPAHLSDLAETLVAFHAAADVALASSPFGTPEAIRESAMDNFTDLLRWVPNAALKKRLGALQAWTLAQWEQLAPLMRARKQAGRVRECHGDLHLANLVLVDRRVRMFDCIEFSDDLRWIDVANEMAFTYVDLLAHGQPGLANWWVNETWSRSGDYEAAGVFRFYAVYRALVRAKVAALGGAHESEVPYGVLAYVALAEQLRAPHPPRVVITHGVSGCGKTMITTQMLLADLSATTVRVRSDVERKRLFGLTPQAHSGSATGGGIYAPEAHARTYSHLAAMARLLLQAGWSVVVDATFLRRAEREVFRVLAHQVGAAFFIVAPQATRDQLRARIVAREKSGVDASEATLAVLERQICSMEPLDAAERRDVLHIRLSME